jgi:anti-anti-sigma factor
MKTKSVSNYEVVDGARIIRLTGIINAQNSSSVQESVIEAAGEWEEAITVLDLASVDYVSSAALRVFMELWKCAQAAGSEIVLAAPSSGVREVLELTGFQNVFRIVASTADL